MAPARSQSTALNQSSIPFLSTRRLRWIIFVPIENFFLFLFHLPFFFSRYSSEGQCPPSVSLHLFLLGRFYYHYYYFSLSSTLPLSLPLFSSHISCVCDFPQDSADGGALARSHLHRRRVFQRGANRLRQRPEVSKDGAAHSKDTTGRRSASLRGSRIMAALYIDGVYYSN